jgi:hypothetical protein
MKAVFLLIFVFILGPSCAQKIEYTFRNPNDSSYNCYVTVVPENTEIKGLIVRDFSRLPVLPTSKVYPYKWRDLALTQGFMVVYTVSSRYFPELYYDDLPLAILDSMVFEVVERFNLPEKNVFIGGISASGTRALKYAQYCNQGKSQFDMHINGVFAVDSPLDNERFYSSAFSHQQNFKEGMKSEAEMMLRVYPERLGFPEENRERYRNASVFSHTSEDGGNARLLLTTSILLIHEPDIEWWVSERGATYFDINSFDIAGMYNYLKLINHSDIELITTSGLGFDRQGKRNCHSWTIVDEPYLTQWMKSRLK